MPESNEAFKTIDLALRVGELLLSSGAGAADVSAQMDNVSRSCGLRGYTVDVTFTQLAMTHQSRPDEPALLQIRQVRHRETNFDELTAVDRLVRDLVAGKIERDEAAAQLNRIVSAGRRRPRWLVTLALGFMGLGVALMLGGAWQVLLIAFAAACSIDLIQRQLGRRRWPVFYQQAAGGVFATLLAAAITATTDGIGPGRVVTSSIFLLLAGVSFLGAVQDALTGFPLTSAARMLEAVTATVGVIGGVSGGLTLARVLGVGLGNDLGTATVTFGDWPLALAGAAISAGTYAFAVHAPARSIVPIAAIAAAGTAAYLAINRQDISVAWSSGIGALLIGLVSYSIAGRCRVPPLVVVTAAIIPLLPGLTLYRALALFGQGRAGGLLSLAGAAAITIALSSGVILGQYVAQPHKREARRLETKLAGPRLVGPMTVRSVRRRRGAAG
jgi:uncharacterized membrane protein YjjP (DUF1212 family)